ncbi:hypothetical protein [Variovorax sp.]|jgi:hypothetical protein|uniref:hypothetical protein n=1 Tax=Variovorax sp. TaxID=1871043 RepID=UPI0011FD2C9C|nr:hypothetical protein [Variovorax sp.]TAJ62859.1 MAG: hypothetical protein EPO53_17210 [Variovorax sp.]
MPTEIHEFPKHLHQILKRYTSVMSHLEFEYKRSLPSPDGENFKADVVEPAKKFALSSSDIPSLLEPGGINEIIKFISSNRIQIESDVAFIHISCIYSTVAMVALERNEIDLAWDLLCQANGYLSVATFTNRGEEIFSNTIANVYVKTRATEAALKRHERTNQLKKRVHEFVRDQAPWPSQANAVYAAESMLQSEFGEKCLEDSPTTITKWVKEMPDRLELIPSLKQRLK